jgi:ankyrin repeat protein
MKVAFVACVTAWVASAAMAGDPQSDLVAAVRSGNGAKAAAAIRSGAKPLGEGGPLGSPAEMAIWYRDAGVLRAMLDSGVDLSDVQHEGWNGLDLAMHSDLPSPELIKLYLDAGVKLSPENLGGLSPLMTQAAVRSAPITRLFLEKGERADDVDKTKTWTPLILASWIGSPEVVTLLIENGAPVSFKAGGRTAVHFAARRGGEEAGKIIDTLAAAHAPLDQTDKDGWTPLMYAASTGSLAAVDALIRAGADVNKVGAGGYRPLHVAALAGDAPTLSRLLQAKPDLNATDDKDRTPLMWALCAADPAQAARWQRRGILGGASATDTATVLRRIESMDPEEKISALLKAGADVNTTDESGWTPLMLAAFMWDGSRIHDELHRADKKDSADWNQGAWEAFASRHDPRTIIKSLLDAGAKRLDSENGHCETDVAAQRADTLRADILTMLRAAPVRSPGN